MLGCSKYERQILTHPGISSDERRPWRCDRSAFKQHIPGGDVTTWLNAQHLRIHNKTTLFWYSFHTKTIEYAETHETVLWKANDIVSKSHNHKTWLFFSLFQTSSTFAVWSRTASGSDVTQWMSWHWHCGIICSVVCFFLLTHPSQYGCISQARKLILDAFFR